MSAKVCAECGTPLAVNVASFAAYCMATPCQNAKRRSQRQAKRRDESAAGWAHAEAILAKFHADRVAAERSARHQREALLTAVGLASVLLGKMRRPSAWCAHCRRVIARGRYCHRSACQSAKRSANRSAKARRDTHRTALVERCRRLGIARFRELWTGNRRDLDAIVAEALGYPRMSR